MHLAMDQFHYRNGQLYCEQVDLCELADQVGTPAYVYSAGTLRHHYKAFAEAFTALNPIICYSIKSCGNLNICQLLAELGAGMDVVSGGELYRAIEAGADPSKIVYAGVGKTDQEIEQGIKAGIGWFNIESEAEFENIAAIAARLGQPAHGALRVNPDVADQRTHAKTATGHKHTKFGVNIDQTAIFFDTYGKNAHCELDAIHLHIGSPIYSPEPYVQAIAKVLTLIAQLRATGHVVRTLDIGGGFAADYETDASPSYAEYAKAIVPLLQNADLRVILEPGRTISGNAGVLLSRVQYVKQAGEKRFVIVDGGMHNLIRPAMYDAFHFIWPVRVDARHVPPKRAQEIHLPDLVRADVVGPICETGDVLARDRALPPVDRGDLLCIFTAGAYGMAMASNYNSIPRPIEVLVDCNNTKIIRQRESYMDLVAHEKCTGSV